MAATNSITYPTRHTNWKRGCGCEECKQYISDYYKAWSKNNPRKHDPIKKREYQRRYCATEKGKQKHREYQKKYGPPTYKEGRKEYDRKLYLRNRAKILQQKQRYRIAHPEAFRRYAKSERGKAASLQRQALRRGAKGTCTAEQLRARWDYYGQRCYLCKSPATSTDHVIPIIKGGTNWPANLRPACKSCNAKKHAMSLSRYLRTLTLT